MCVTFMIYPCFNSSTFNLRTKWYSFSAPEFPLYKHDSTVLLLVANQISDPPTLPFSFSCSSVSIMILNYLQLEDFSPSLPQVPILYLIPLFISIELLNQIPDASANPYLIRYILFVLMITLGGCLALNFFKALIHGMNILLE